MTEQLQINILDDVKLHQADLTWIRDNEETLFDFFSDAINNGTHDHNIVDGLLRVFPYIFTHGKLKHWVKLLYDVTVLFDVDETDTEHATQTSRAYMADFQPPEHAQRMIKTALRRARKRIDPSLMLQLYVNLFKSQIYFHNIAFNQALIFSALDLGRQVNEQESYGLLYQSLGFAYNHWQKPQKALEFGRLAYAYWSKTRNEYEHAMCTYIMAVAYRLTDEFEDASRWLEETSRLLNKTKYQRQYALITAETGAIFLQKKMFEEAESWTEKALNEYLELGDQHSASIAHRAIATAQIALGKFDPAEKHLNQALNYWQSEEPDNIYQQQQIYHTFASMEYSRTDKKQAITYIKQSRELAMQLPEQGEFRAARLENLAMLEKDINEL